MRFSLAAVAGGTLVVALGAAGLIRGAMPQPAAGAASPSGGGTISVVGAYVVAPVPPVKLAAAYFTVYNTTSSADELQSVQTGAGSTAQLHVLVGGVMSAVDGAVTIPAHGSLTLSVGKGHVMIGGLFGTLKPGQTVDMELQFRNAGVVQVTAPVVAVGTGPPAAPSTAVPATASTSDSAPAPADSSTSAPSGAPS